MTKLTIKRKKRFDVYYRFSNVNREHQTLNYQIGVSPYFFIFRLYSYGIFLDTFLQRIEVPLVL